MKIVLGSKSQDKINILKNALEELHLKVDIKGVESESEITGQPLDKKTTKKGAVNRAKNAFKKSLDSDFAFGLEGGLHDYGEGYHLVTYACLVDRKTGKEFIGEGEEIRLPLKVSEEIKNGGWFGDAIREYSKDHEIDENLITRMSPFTQAIQSAFAEYLRSEGNLGFRKKALGIIIDFENNFLIDQLTTYSESDWNFPGGGIEEGETEEEALLRELEEELGTHKFKILNKSKTVNKYEWPAYSVAKRLKAERKSWKGQEVRTFLVRFTGKKEDIKPNSVEIREIRWIKYDELKDYLNFPHQLKNTKKLLKEWKFS